MTYNKQHFEVIFAILVMIHDCHFLFFKQGLLSFLSAPLVGALSDVWGRKFFLVVTVFFTCAPIPLIHINTWWYFAMISISGVFAVTFSVVFAYVADVTDESERSAAYGLVWILTFLLTSNR